MSDDLLTMPGTLLAENEARHEVKPGCHCLRCTEERLKAAITAEMFCERVGRPPEQDDLARCNCAFIGVIGHTMCGWDVTRDLPRFIAVALDVRDARGEEPTSGLRSEPIPVTEPMREAAKIAAGPAFYAADEKYDDIFRAMRALEPARDNDFQAMLKAYREQYALAVERAGEIAELMQAVTCDMGPALLKCQRERDDAVARTFILRDACERADADLATVNLWKRSAVDQLAAKDARIAELKSELAAFTIANAAPVVETETPHNPFRDFPTDHRRMGP